MPGIPNMSWHHPLFYKATCPNSIYTWLCDTGSLTRKIQQLSRVAVNVTVLEEKTEPCPLLWYHCFPQHCGPVWRREVQLYTAGEPVIRAVSVLPLAACATWARPLRFSHNRALGHLLFAMPSVRRFGMQLGYLQNQWGRYSLFAPPKHQAILIQETFLPALITRITEQSAARRMY